MKTIGFISIFETLNFYRFTVHNAIEFIFDEEKGFFHLSSFQITKLKSYLSVFVVIIGFIYYFKYRLSLKKDKKSSLKSSKVNHTMFELAQLSIS